MKTALAVAALVASPVIAAVVSWLVTRATLRGSAARELASDVRRYRMERAERLRVAYTAAVRLARAINTAAQAEAHHRLEESLQARRERLGAPIDAAQVLYDEKSAELLLDDDGMHIEDLITKMTLNYRKIAFLTSRHHDQPGDINWDKVVELEEAVKQQLTEVTDGCRASLRALDVSRSEEPS